MQIVEEGTVKGVRTRRQELLEPSWRLTATVAETAPAAPSSHPSSLVK